LKVGDTQGTVEAIGLRSTRIRTPDRTVISLPNGQVANAVLENVSARDKFWFHPDLSLTRETTAAQMRSVLDGVNNLLAQNSLVELDSIRVRFLRFADASLDVDVFAYVLARDWSQFLEIQEGLQFQMMKCIESTGVRIAFPSPNIYLSPPSDFGETNVQWSLKTATPETQPINEAAAKSA